MGILLQAERFIESQGFHLMTEEDIPKFARCAAESYGSITYALDDYFVGHPCTKDELWEMWLFNLKYLSSYKSFAHTSVTNVPITLISCDVVIYGNVKCC